jgi:SpoVK/Ycf46/Vps4 family AAA+-type ATPase
VRGTAGKRKKQERRKQKTKTVVSLFLPHPTNRATRRLLFQQTKQKTVSRMENSFVPQAIEIVSKAIEADNAGEYEKALSLYRDALGRFTMGLKYEKNEARKKLVIERVEGYMKRAEELRDYVAKQNELEKSGAGGAATKKAGDKDEDVDAEKKKLRGALAGAIVSEKPNIRWEDVAGLENAKESLKEVGPKVARRAIG